MKTNKKFYSFRWLATVCLLFFSLSGIGQEIEIIGIKINNVSKEKATITYLLPDERHKKKEEIEVRRKFPKDTQFETSDSTEITAFNGNYKILVEPGSKIVENRVSGKVKVTKEEGLLDKAVSVVKSWFNWFGGPSNEIQGAVEGTKFSIEAEGDNFKIDLDTGKVAINKRIKVILNEKFISIDSIPKRELFITETIDILSIKNRHYNSKSDTLKERTLNTEEKIDQFFKDQLSRQKRILTNGGPNSRQGFRLMEQGQDSLGKVMYSKAMEYGEINSDKFIQASLILVEAYYRNDDFKNRSAWLDAALHYIRLNDSINKRKYDRFKAAGENDFRIGYGKDRVVSKKYYAWAYTVKLKVTGCLEAPDQNPSKWLNDAKKLSDSLR